MPGRILPMLCPAGWAEPGLVFQELPLPSVQGSGMVPLAGGHHAPLSCIELSTCSSQVPRFAHATDRPPHTKKEGMRDFPGVAVSNRHIFLPGPMRQRTCGVYAQPSKP